MPLPSRPVLEHLRCANTTQHSEQTEKPVPFSSGEIMKVSPSRSPSSSSSDSSAPSSFNVLQLGKLKKPNKRAPKPRPDKPQSGNADYNGKRSSAFRGVTRHRWTGRFEAHLWDKHYWNNIQSKKGRQVYLGAYDDEAAAAHTHDLAALKYWGPAATLNFPLETYSKEYEEMQGMTREEYLASLRRRSSGFSRGVSKYRGVARHHQNGRWEARIGRVLGNKYLYLGTFNTQEEAAQAYDLAAIAYRGFNAITNFDISSYIKCPKPQLLPMPEPEAQQGEQRFEEINKRVDQIVVEDCTTEIPWTPFFDHDLDISTCHYVGLHDFLDSDGFEDNIEYLFEGFEAIEVHNNDSDIGLVKGMVVQGEVELMEQEIPSQVKSTVSYPPPITICS